MGKIKSFINILKGKFIVLISTIHGKIIVIAIMGILSAGAVTGAVVGGSNNSSGGIVPSGKHKWYPIKPQTKTTPWSDLAPSISPIPSKGRINLNSMSIFTSKQTHWNTGVQTGFFPTYYKYSLTMNLKDTNILTSGGLYYVWGMRTHGFANITVKTNFQYSKNNNELFNNLSVYSKIGWNTQNFGPQFTHTTILNTNELININNKISPKINPLLSKLKQGQKLIISGINYYYNFTILSHGNGVSNSDGANILININSLDYSIIDK